MTRQKLIAAVVALAVTLGVSAGCTQGDATPKQQGSSDVGGGFDNQTVTSSSSVPSTTSTTLPKNPNVDNWFSPQGLNKALFSDQEVACMKAWLAQNPDVANTIDVSRASRTEWSKNARKVELQCVPKEKMGFLWVDDYAKQQKKTVAQPERECVAKAFAELTDDQIISFDQAVVQTFGQKLMRICPNLAPSTTAPK